MPDTRIKERAETILHFVTQIACPFGSSNRGAASEARKKIVTNRNLKNKSLDWNDLEATDPEPWQTSELKGIKGVIANDLQCTDDIEVNYTIYNFQDVIKVAQKCITYGNGRCAGMAAVGLVYNQELEPSIPVTVLHYIDPENSSINHALLFVGFDAANPARNADTVYFCDPWVNKIGPLESLNDHLITLGIYLNSNRKLKPSIEWCPDDSVSPAKPITPVALEERQPTIDRINELHRRFIQRNNELLGLESQQIRILRRHFPKLAVTGFWQDHTNYVLGARITPNMLSEQTSVVDKLSELGIYGRKTSNMTADVIIDGINDEDENGIRISRSI